jgi:hypothetical protein
MPKTRKIVAYLATSADGYIARPDGDVDWLNNRPRAGDYGMREFYRSIDTILIGRKTYDWAMNYYREIGKTRGGFDTIRVGASEAVRSTASFDAGKKHLDDGRWRVDRVIP